MNVESERVRMDSTKRRAVFEAVRDRTIGLGLKFEDDPVFLAAVEDWIVGRADAADFRKVYLSLLAQREQSRRVEHFVKHCLR